MRIEDALRRSAAADPAKAAIVDGGVRLTFAELDSMSDALAASFSRRSVGRGDRVLVLMENVWQAAVAIFGILKAGAVFCPVSPSVKVDGLRFVIGDCEPRAILTQLKHLRLCAEAVADSEPAPGLFAAGGPESLPDGVVALEDCLAASEPPPAAGSDAELAMIIHTSGSTGRPKGVMMSHASMDFAAGAIASYLENTSDDVVLGALPLSFTYGLYQLLVAARVGATLALQKNFAFPAEVLATARAEGVTGLPLVPTMAAVLLAMRDLGPDALPRLRYITNAAAPLPPAHVAGLRRLFPGAKLFSMYGLTECARAAYLPPEEIDRRPGSVGRAIPGTDVAILDEASQAVAPGETGELVVQGPHLMRGYWRNDAATARALRPGADGRPRLHTGDLFRADPEGFLHFVGRTDDVVKIRGEKVAPKQVEAVLHDCPGVAEAMVVARPDPVSGHVLHAVIVRSMPALTEREVMKHCARALPDVMVPKSVEFRNELPKTASGKVLRRLVA